VSGKHAFALFVFLVIFNAAAVATGIILLASKGCS